MNWMFPYALSTTTMGSATAGSTAPWFEPDDATSSPGGDQQEADSVYSPSAASFSSSSSSTDHLSFITSTQRRPSTSPLCFGAGKLLWRSKAGARAHVSKTKQEEPDAAPKGDAVRRYLRKISRRLRKARRGVKESPPPPPPFRRGTVVDDTERERAVALASAVVYCKESLRRGTSTLRLVPSPSLDCWLQGRRKEVIASAAATHCNECADSQCTPLPLPRQDGWLLERQAKATLRNDVPRIAHGEEPPHHGHDTGNEFSGEAATAEETAMSSSSPSHSVHREFNISGSFNEIDFLKTFNGEEEIIGRHFITILI